ncbi:MAG: S-layer homology domain-containing protein [Lachnospiraceae bacterium]|nr:S-layer homology domain-containing protein [Lachnospiraceae bacterium]
MGYSLQEDVNVEFQDISGQWYTDYVATAYACGIVSGKAADRFDPDSNVTRAELVVMLYNIAMMDYQKGEYFALIIPDEQKSFTLTAEGETLFDYNADTQGITGDVQVKEKVGGRLVYFPASSSVEIVPSENTLVEMQILANGSDVNIAGMNLKKVELGEDHSVACYCNDTDVREASEVHISRLLPVLVINEISESVEIAGVYQITDAPDYGETSEFKGAAAYTVEWLDGGTKMTPVSVKHEPCEFLKISPGRDTSFGVSAFL